jgi:multimeric flavodoxin WrbA
MKVVAVNGSPHKNGNTFHALNVMGKIFNQHGIEFEILHIGSKAVRGCTACGKCAITKDETCTITSDPLNEWVQILKDADGIILSSPVYYAGMNGTMKCFLDRAFYVAGSNGNLFRHKVGASVVAVRRSGGSATFDSLNHYLLYSEMIIAGSNYWNITHGLKAGDAEHDSEGTQIMEVLANNLAWLLKMRQMTKDTLPAPDPITKEWTHFVR